MTRNSCSVRTYTSCYKTGHASSLEGSVHACSRPRHVAVSRGRPAPPQSCGPRSCTCAAWSRSGSGNMPTTAMRRQSCPWRARASASNHVTNSEGLPRSPPISSTGRRLWAAAATRGRAEKADRTHKQAARGMPHPLSLQPRVLLDVIELDSRQVVLVEQLLQQIATLG